jgi:hypothetical protein
LGCRFGSTGSLKKILSNFHCKNDFFPITFSVQVSVDPKEHFIPLKQKSIFLPKMAKTVSHPKGKN